MKYSFLNVSNCTLNLLNDSIIAEHKEFKNLPKKILQEFYENKIYSTNYGKNFYYSLFLNKDEEYELDCRTTLSFKSSIEQRKRIPLFSKINFSIDNFSFIYGATFLGKYKILSNRISEKTVFLAYFENQVYFIEDILAVYDTILPLDFDLEMINHLLFQKETIFVPILKKSDVSKFPNQKNFIFKA